MGVSFFTAWHKSDRRESLRLGKNDFLHIDSRWPRQDKNHHLGDVVDLEVMTMIFFFRMAGLSGYFWLWEREAPARRIRAIPPAGSSSNSGAGSPAAFVRWG